MTIPPRQPRLPGICLWVSNNRRSYMSRCSRNWRASNQCLRRFRLQLHQPTHAILSEWISLCQGSHRRPSGYDGQVGRQARLRPHCRGTMAWQVTVERLRRSEARSSALLRWVSGPSSGSASRRGSLSKSPPFAVPGVIAVSSVPLGQSTDVRPSSPCISHTDIDN